MTLVAQLRALGRPRLLVVGDALLDRYVWGDARRISPEAPIPVLTAAREEARPGGAANVAVNVAALGADAALVGVVGRDAEAGLLREALRERGVDPAGLVEDPARPTIVKTRLVAGSQQVLRLDREETRPVAGDVEARVLERAAREAAARELTLVSDYAKGCVTDRLLRAVIDAARGARRRVVVDPKGEDYARYRGVSILTPNLGEFETAVGRRARDPEALREAGRSLVERLELEALLVTLGRDGIFLLTRDGRHQTIPTAARSVYDVTGAGDTVLSVLGVALAGGLGFEDAVRLANAAAGIKVSKVGAAAVAREELEAELSRPAPGSGGRVLTRAEAASVARGLRAEGKTLVFTNGCFDIVHAGHVQFLRDARALGDALMVGLNEDASVKALKGPKRPVIPLADRAELLAALRMVDYVVPFGEPTPTALIQEVLPAVLVKGEDWRDKGVVGREIVEAHGGRVALLPLRPGLSTTGLIERIVREP